MSKMTVSLWMSVWEQMPMLALCVIGLGLLAWLLFSSRIQDWFSFRRAMSCWQKLERRSLQGADVDSPFVVIATVSVEDEEQVANSVEDEEQVAKVITIWRGESRDEAQSFILDFGPKQAHRKITVEYSIHDGASNRLLWSWTINGRQPGHLFRAKPATAEST